MAMQQPLAAECDVKEASTIHNMDFVENAEDATVASNLPAAAARLSKPHRDYLMENHGTLNLDPIPAMDSADPYNWPEWKVGYLEPPQKQRMLIRYDARRK